MFVYGAGNAICVRCRVTPLKPEEAAGIGDALAELAHVYGIQFDARVEAWIGLGGAVSQAAMPRIQEYQPPPPEKPAEELTPETRSPAPPPKPEPAPAPVETQRDKDGRSFSAPA